jgi:hypothetical protein
VGRRGGEPGGRAVAAIDARASPTWGEWLAIAAIRRRGRRVP